MASYGFKEVTRAAEEVRSKIKSNAEWFAGGVVQSEINVFPKEFFTAFPILKNNPDAYESNEYRVVAFTMKSGNTEIVINGKLDKDTNGDESVLLTLTFDFRNPAYVDWLMEKLASDEVKGKSSEDGSLFLRNVLIHLYVNQSGSAVTLDDLPFSKPSRLLEFVDIRKKPSSLWNRVKKMLGK